MLRSHTGHLPPDVTSWWRSQSLRVRPTQRSWSRPRTRRDECWCPCISSHTSEASGRSATGWAPERHPPVRLCGSLRRRGSGQHGSRHTAAEIVPHPLSLARYILGVEVGRLEWHLDRPTAGEWRCSATTTHGTIISAMISFRTRPTFASCRLLGESGTAAPRPVSRIRQLRGGTRLAVVQGDPARSGRARLGRSRRDQSDWSGTSRRAGVSRPPGPVRGGVRRRWRAGPPPYADDEIADVARARERLLTLAARPLNG